MDGDLTGFEGTNSQQGQGLAYVLPQSRTTGYFMQLANERAQQRRQDAQRLQLQQQKQNEEYAQHLYQFKTPEIANEYTKWLQPQFDSLIQQASDYHAKTGQDPFTNPNFVARTNDLNTTAKNTHSMNLKATALGTALADKSKNYTPESKQAAAQWLQGYYKDPVAALNTQPPPLEQRDLGLNDAIKLGHANSIVQPEGQYNVTRPNTHNHIVQGQEILAQPEFAPLLQKQYGVNTDVGDVFGQPNGKGGTIYPTDAPTVNAIADHVLQNAAQPHYVATLQAAGIDPSDPHAKDKLVDIITKQNNGYGKALTDFASRLDANVEQKKVRDYTPDRLALSADRLALSRERLDNAEAKKAGKEAQVTYFDDLANRIYNKTPGSGEELGERVRINPAFNGKTLKVNDTDQTKLTIEVPTRYKTVSGEQVVDKPAYRVTLDKTDPDKFKAGFSSLYKDITGENVTLSKGMTPSGTGKMNQSAETKIKSHGKVATMQQIQSKVGTKGYEGYTAQELADYYRAQGYTIK